MIRLAIIPVLVLALSSESQAREDTVGKVKTKKAASTRLYVETNPPGAKITLDGKALGVSNGLFSVAAGEYDITIALPGYEPVRRKVKVRGKRIGELRLDLKRLPGAVGTVKSMGLIPPRSRSVPPSIPRVRTPAMPEPPAVATLKGHQAQINTIEFSPEGRFLATASSDNTVRVWDVPSGKLRHKLTGQDSKLGVYAATF